MNGLLPRQIPCKMPDAGRGTSAAAGWHGPAIGTSGFQILRTAAQPALHVALRQIGMARQHDGPPIRLVVTDVIMPVMGGRLMAEWLKTAYPDLKILFTSGYTDDVITDQGVQKTRSEFLPKPYTTVALAGKVREILDAN